MRAHKNISELLLQLLQGDVIIFLIYVERESVSKIWRIGRLSADRPEYTVRVSSVEARNPCSNSKGLGSPLSDINRLSVDRMSPAKRSAINSRRCGRETKYYHYLSNPKQPDRTGTCSTRGEKDRGSAG